MSGVKRVNFKRGPHQWSYRGEQWVTPFSGMMSISRWQDQTEPYLFKVERHINGTNLGSESGLSFVDSEALIDRWLETSADDPEIKEYLQDYEARKMARLL